MNRYNFFQLLEKVNKINTYDFFQLLEKEPVCKHFLKIIERGLTIEESHIFNNLIDILSYLRALLISMKSIIFRTS